VLVDLHVHSEGGVREMFEHAKQIGLDGLGFADGPGFEALDDIRSAAQDTGLKGFCGCAVQTNRGVLICYFPDVATLRTSGPWLTVDPDKPPAAKDVVIAVEQRSGVVIAAHPYYKAIPTPMGDHIFSISGLHACEAASPLATGMQRDLAIEASDSLHLPCTGGSAARTAEHVGMAATFFPEDVADEAALCQAIRDKKCFAVLAHSEVPREARPSTPASRPPRVDDRGGRRPHGRRPGGPRRDGPRRDGPRRDGPRRDGPRNDGPRNDGPPRND